METSVKRTPHIVTVFALGAVLAGAATACSTESTAKPDGIGVAEKLPDDTDKARSKQNAADFRSWVEEHGTAEQKTATTRVDRILGEWNEQTGNAYISTDINGGKTQVADPEAAATAIARAFASWKDAKEGYASVYDVYGNAVITNYKF
ncbi:hypothetical protein [Streptomyces sp. HUAS TT20]|uniref:hypothetical protein n=1 Tax=Streptomyces sp. HUAS TT20 TaxID=3447509 RepID=UPI0021D95FA9|nr:hypothetical protein [Streptomyces sp. HUAS 15-9]UXY27722.1 hypothetical protein N8I87_14810 [Streptomyces sp. HUAS 15-9]